MITDFRNLARPPVGNRFLVFALFPQVNVAMRIQRDEGRSDVMVTLGHSILNPTCRVNLGELAARYGGGGHRGAASIRLAGNADAQLRGLVADLTERAPFDLGSLAALPLPPEGAGDDDFETASALGRLTATDTPLPDERRRPD